MLHNLDDATLRANSAVPKATVAKTIVPTDQSVAPSTASAPSDSSSQQGTPVKSDAVNDSEEVQRQHEARIRSGQQASSSTADGQRHQSSSASCQSGPAHTSDATSNASQNAEEVDARASMSTGPCIDSTQLQGSWKVFDLAAVPIDETDIESGESIVQRVAS